MGQPTELNPTDVLRYNNLGIALAYFSVGLTMSFVSTPLNVYMVEVLNAEPPMQTTVGILQTLPWSLKLAFGFLSDAVPIFGMHRKPYLTAGAVLYSSVFLLYALAGVDHVVFLAICMFVGTIGLIMMDVMCDTMCVERSRFEKDSVKGQMQATYYSVRFGGGIVGSFAGAMVYNTATWGWGLTFHQICFINGVIPFLLVTPWLCCLVEKYKHVPVGDELVIVSSDGLATKRKNRSFDQSLEALGVTGENTPLLQAARGNETLHLSHPTTGHITVPHHSSSSTSASAVASSGGTGKDGDEDFEVGLQLQPMMRPSVAGPGQMHGATGALLESHAEVHHAHTGEAAAAGSGEDVCDESDESLYKHVMLQLDDIWNTVQLKSVWRPMAFVYVFNLLQTPNVAWQSYLQLTLHFEPYILGLMVSVGSFMTFFGVLAYKYLFFKTSWRRIYVWSVGLVTFFSLLQLVLVKQVSYTARRL